MSRISYNVAMKQWGLVVRPRALAKWAQSVLQYDLRSERRGRPGRETSVATVGVTAQATPTSVGMVRVAAEGTSSCPRCSRSSKTLHSCVCGIFDRLKEDLESPARIHRVVTFLNVSGRTQVLMLSIVWSTELRPAQVHHKHWPQAKISRSRCQRFIENTSETCAPPVSTIIATTSLVLCWSGIMC